MMKRGIRVCPCCLQARADAEQVERPLLQGGGRRDHVEGRDAGVPRLDPILGHRGQVLHQRVEAVHRQPVLGALRGDLPLRPRRALGWPDDRRAQGLARGGVLVVEEERGQRPAYVPLDIIGQQT